MFIDINMLRFLLIKCFTTCELIVHVYSKIISGLFRACTFCTPAVESYQLMPWFRIIRQAV